MNVRRNRYRSPEEGMCTIDADAVVRFLEDSNCPGMAEIVQSLNKAPERLRLQTVAQQKEISRLTMRLHKYEPPDRSSGTSYRSECE